MSIFDFKRKKYRTFLQDSETGEEIAEEYEKGRGVWKKHDVQDGKGSEMRENLIRKHYWFSGRVQGVGFRYRACYIASSLGVTGWVRNNWDDRVEMEAQGSRELLAQMVEMLGRQRFIEIPGLRFSKDPANVAEENCLGLLAVGCDWWLKEKRDGGLLVLWNRKVSYI